MVAVPQLQRPLLRGVIHQAAFSVSLVIGTLLIVFAEGAGRRLAAAAFAASVVVCFGTSALYHRVAWTPRLRSVMRRLDHAAIFLLIAGTYTPVGLLVLSGSWRWLVLGFVWASVAVVIVLALIWSKAPQWVPAAAAIVIGWAGVAAVPQIVAHAGGGALTLLLAGGLAYTAGAVVYTRRRPDPRPSVFGYHEVFHALTIVAVALQYAAIAFFIIRVG